jgi:2-polyprenyl-3-methyl-5-hydroxy-6-metoxy-1,4-benzoquinol methylase
MNKEVKKKLYDNYSLRVDLLDDAFDQKLKWFKLYFSKFYQKTFKEYNPNNTKVLDLGCNRGYLLKVIKDQGYDNIVGIDLSPGDLEHARKLDLNCELLNIDAFDFLASNQSKFDIIVIKAVLEHISKDKIEELLNLMHNSLKIGGSLIIDVPNMDWLFASHERYMDFTHEVGFTKESLDQIVRLYFKNYHIFTADNIMFQNVFLRLRKNIIRRLITMIFNWAEPEGVLNPIWDRTLIAVCKRI